LPAKQTRISDHSRIYLWLIAFAWIGNALYAFGVPDGELKKWSPALVAPAMIGFVIMHARVQWRGGMLWAFTLIVFSIGWLLETISIHTGFPFGNYHYGINMWPFIGDVPISVLPAYWVMAYICWNLAVLFYHNMPQRRRKAWLHPITLIGAALMVIWDVSMDPLRAIVEGRWHWLDGGAYHGIPITNFIGWFVVTWLMLQSFALYAERRDKQWSVKACPGNKRFWVGIPLLYLAFPVEYVLNPLTFWLRSGLETSTELFGIYQQTAIVTLLTMVPVAVGAIALLIRPPRRQRSVAATGNIARETGR